MGETSDKEREKRRVTALGMWDAGWNTDQIAKALGVKEAEVYIRLPQLRAKRNKEAGRRAAAEANR